MKRKFAYPERELAALVDRYEEILRSHVPTYFDVDELVALIEYYVSNGYDDVLDGLTQFALTLHPDNTELILYRCRILALLGRMEEFKELIYQLPESLGYDVILLRAAILLDEGRIDEAEARFEKAAAEGCRSRNEDRDEDYDENLDEEYVDFLLDIGELYGNMHMEKYERKWVEKAYALEPDYERAQLMMADALVHTGETEKGVALYEGLIDLYPYEISYWIRLAECYIIRKEYLQAAEAINMALAIDEKDEEALHWRKVIQELLAGKDEITALIRRIDDLTC